MHQKVLPQSGGLIGATLLPYSGSTKGPQAGQPPPAPCFISHTHPSERTQFFSALHGTSAVFAGASSALVRLQEREDKHYKTKCVATWVRSRSNEVNVEERGDAGAK